MTKTEVAKKTVAGAVALAEGMNLEELEADAGIGTQMGVADVALPYVYILQTNSPQCNKAHSEYIKGAEAGMFMNNVTSELFEGEQQGLIVVPCAYERKLVEWVDREKGGGWVADYPPDHKIKNDVTMDQNNKPRLPNGNMLFETAYQYCLFYNPTTEVWGQCCIAMKSTGLKKNRMWNNAIVEATIPGTNKKAPRFLFPYQLRTVVETKGDNAWFNYDIERLPQTVTPEVYAAAKRFHELVSAGTISRGVEQETGAVEQVTVTGDEKLDDEIPF